jgi:VWFA-related protein
MLRILSPLFLFSLSVPLLGQEGSQATAPQTSAPSVRSLSEEVLLDVVVRDKKGHRVDDLKREDFQIFDNGGPKEITSFRLVQGAEALGAGGARIPLDPLRQIRLVTMIFHCSDITARQFAHDAALDLLKGELPQNVYMAVMAIDHKLEVLQPFTNDMVLLRKGIERARGGRSGDFSKDTEAVRRQLQEMLGPSTNGAPSLQAQVNNLGPTGDQGRPSNPPAFASVATAQMLLEIIQTEQSNAMTESGRTAIYALLDVVKEQHRLPGRKTILYFSEGFVVPQEVREPFNQTISIANRSNVSFYTVDAHGLMTTRTNRAAVTMFPAQSSHDQATATSTIPVRREEAPPPLIDTSIDSIRANTQSALGELAQSTGGVLIANTNDLRGPLHKLAEDIQTYYEISYNPQIKTYDGSFHRITIKMASRDLQVQSRSGYIALPPALARGNTVGPFEIPLLTALDSPDPPRAFGFEATAMHFRGRQGQPVCELVMDVPLADVTLEKQGTGVSSGRLSYVVLLKDGQGEVVKKFENERAFNVPADKLDGFKVSHFIFAEHFDLPPGGYTVETAVLDGQGNRISARKSSVMMPLPTTLALSSVTFIRSTKDREPSGEEVDPLVVGTKVISPTLNPVISKANAIALPFFMVVYPDKSAVSAPQFEMELSRNGQVLGRGPAQLGQPDKDGRFPFVATVPLGHLEPGDFTLRFVVKQGPERAEETASFTLQ